MLLTMAIMTGLGSALLEIFLCRAIRPLHTLIKMNQAIDIAFSFGLSYVLSGGNGVTTILAGVISTVLTTLWWRAEDHILPWWHEVENNWEKNKDEFLQTMHDLWRVTWFLIRVVTFPLRVMRWALSMLPEQRQGTTPELTITKEEAA